MEGWVWVIAADGFTAKLNDENVFVRLHVVLQESVSNDHVNSVRFDELSDLNFLDATKVGDELEIQIAGRPAGFALTDCVSTNDHGLALEIRKHSQALIDELFILQRSSFR